MPVVFILRLFYNSFIGINEAEFIKNNEPLHLTYFRTILIGFFTVMKAHAKITSKAHISQFFGYIVLFRIVLALDSI